ncbi:MAG TPA: hypothetical protein PK114_07585, partial [Smithellaceae bacterium]|nr:hypothetical protein [Smithellaceae bacterium]
LLTPAYIVNTDLLSLYADTSGNIGVLRGNVYGPLYSAEYGFKAEQGGLNRIQMATGTGVAASTFVASGTSSSSSGLATGTYSNLLYNGPAVTLTNMSASDLSISNYNWGIGKAALSGNYDSDPRGNVVFDYNFTVSGTTAGTESIVYTEHASATSWTSASGGYFRGDVAGATTNWQSAATFVFGGTIKGVFDLASSGTWSGTALSTRIETGAFVDMASTAAGQQKLADLNIPGVIVGSVNMSLSTADAYWSSLSINNMGFYASTSGGTPQIWASKDIAGSLVSTSIGTDASSALTGTSGNTTFNANFVVKRWDGNKWAADIKNGTISPALNGADTFRGGAAGTYNGKDIVSGTAAGTAHKGGPY